MSVHICQAKHVHQLAQVGSFSPDLEQSGGAKSHMQHRSLALQGVTGFPGCLHQTQSSFIDSALAACPGSRLEAAGHEGAPSFSAAEFHVRVFEEFLRSSSDSQPRACVSESATIIDVTTAQPESIL